MSATIASTLALVAAALAVAAGLGATIFRPVRRFTRKASQFMDGWNGEEARPGIPARPGVMERLAGIETNQSAISGESQLARSAVQRALAASESRSAAVFADIEQRLDDIQSQVEPIHRELQSNGGGSIKDQITRVDKALNHGDARSVQEEH